MGRVYHFYFIVGALAVMTKTEAVTQMMFCLEVSNDVKSSDKLQGQMVWR